MWGAPVSWDFQQHFEYVWTPTKTDFLKPKNGEQSPAKRRELC